MPEVFIGEAMVTALAELGAEVSVVEVDGGTTTESAAGDYQPTTAMPDAAPVQVPLFEPPPFNFEEAYDELHRLDRRAQNRKSAWESLKGAASDAKKDYDSAIGDLHAKFDEIDSARRVAAAVHVAPKPTQEEVIPQMSEEMEQTTDEPTPPQLPPTEPEKEDGDETPVE